MIDADVTMDHKTSHKGTFFEIEISISKLSVDVWFVRIEQYLDVQLKNYLNIEKIACKMVQFLSNAYY